MLEVEGGTPSWCMKILRHEAGHAIDNAYKLRQRLRRQQIFGPSYMQYPAHYQPKPYSKSFVLHLDSWYAQSHPDEDFAETFATWLKPDSDWRTRYADWPAIKKLEYMDSLMQEIAGKPMIVKSRRKLEPISALRKTLALALPAQAPPLRSRASSLLRSGSAADVLRQTGTCRAT